MTARLLPPTLLAMMLAAFTIASATGSVVRSPSVVPKTTASGTWQSYNGDVASERYSPLKQINISNIGKVRAVCSADLAPAQRFETGPIIIRDVLYATAGAQTFALNATTCAPIWTHTYALAGSTGTDRGAAFANATVYRGYSSGHFIAINATTGNTKWDVDLVPSGSLETIAAAPIAWEGAVYIGTVGGDSGQMGHVYCLDGANGKVIWSVQTVPNLGDPLASTWQGATRIAGGSTWTSYALDTSSGLLYVPVANPGPVFDVRERAGANLYTDSVIAYNAMTGALVEADQATPEDDHDWDMGATPALVRLVDGTSVALTASKDGYLRELTTPALTQRWQTAVTTIENASAPITVAGTHFCPGTTGGALWNGPAFSPLTQLAYVGSVDRCSTVDLSPTPQPYVPGHAWTGSTNSFGTPDAAMAGWITAVNAATGNIAWQYHSPTPMVAGVTVTAGGLLLTGDLNGNILAFNATSGAQLRSFATELPVGGGIATYAVGGKQYIAVAAGMSSSVFQTPNNPSEILVFGL